MLHTGHNCVTAFFRDPHGTLTTHPDATWVEQGLGAAAPLWDGTGVEIGNDGTILIAQVIPPGKKIPDRLLNAVDTDDATIGWLSIEDATKATRKRIDTILDDQQPEPGRYVLIGPGIDKNPHHYDVNVLKPFAAVDVHDAARFAEPFPRNPVAVAQWLDHNDVFGGIMWSHIHTPERYATVRRADVT